MLWFNCRHKRSLVECRLICFPWSGGGTGFFSAWGAHFPDTIEVVGIRLPGRESRMDEPLITNITELSEQVAEEIYKNYKDEPFAFFGHSMGLITSFHTALTLQKKYDIKPVALFVSGTFAPNSAVRKVRIADPTYARWSQLNDDDLIDVVENLGGTSPELLEDKEFMKKIFLPPFRADLAVTEFYYHDSTKTPPLSCKVVSMDGDEDREHNQEDFRHLTSASFEKLKFPGKHFYLLKEDNVRGVANLISDALRGLKIEEQEACALDYFD